MRSVARPTRHIVDSATPAARSLSAASISPSRRLADTVRAA
jgi:hypothetical protein